MLTDNYPSYFLVIIVDETNRNLPWSFYHLWLSWSSLLTCP